MVIACNAYDVAMMYILYAITNTLQYVHRIIIDTVLCVSPISRT